MKKLIDVYDQIRNVQYKIVDVDYSLSNSYRLVDSNGASCTPKHIVLFDMFSAFGFETRLCVHEFQWLDFNLEFPKYVSDLLTDFSSDFHTNIEIKIGDNWIMVDATWDDKLIDAGLPGTKEWNGKESTLNAVHSNTVHRFNSIAERKEFLIQNIKKDKDLDKERECIDALNNYFDLLRK